MANDIVSNIEIRVTDEDEIQQQLPERVIEASNG